MADSPGDAAASMRLDRFLWFARIVKSRSIAQALAADGRLRIDGRTVDRAAAAVRVGAVLAFATPAGRIRALRIAALPARRGPPAQARLCYVDLLETPPRDNAPQRERSD